MRENVYLDKGGGVRGEDNMIMMYNNSKGLRCV